MKPNFFSRITSAITSPILRELPFFVAFILLIGTDTFRAIHSQIVKPDPNVGVLNLVGQFSFVVMMAYIFTVIVASVGKRWLKIVFYIVIVALFTISTFLFQNFGMTIKPYNLTLLLESNGREASEFFRMFVLSKGSIATYCLLSFVIAAIVLAESAYRKKVGSHPQLDFEYNLPIAITVLCLLGLGLYASTSFIRLLRCETPDDYYLFSKNDAVTLSDPISRITQSSYALHLASREMKTAVESTRQMDRNVSMGSPDSINVVLVIGESFNKWHSNLYGYPLNTMPKLSREAAEGRLTVFDDAVCNFALTSPSMKNMLCCNSIADGESWSKSPYFPALFKAAGFQVFLWDNQKDVDPSSFFSFALNSFLYNDEILERSYTAVNEHSYPYDYSLIENFKKTAARSTHNLMVFHLLGQHYDAKGRYPKVPQFMHFTADSIHRTEPYLTDKMREDIAHYDNATLYNDHVVNSIIDLFRDQNTVLVYLSDHGEEIYDYNASRARDYTGLNDNWMKYVHEVPFFIWCSDKYAATHPTTIEAVRRAAHQPFTTDNLCQLMFDLGQLHTSYYKADRDPLSSQFKPRKRVVEGMEDQVRGDFDEIRKR